MFPDRLKEKVGDGKTKTFAFVRRAVRKGELLEIENKIMEIYKVSRMMEGPSWRNLLFHNRTKTEQNPKKWTIGKGRKISQHPAS